MVHNKVLVHEEEPAVLRVKGESQALVSFDTEDGLVLLHVGISGISLHDLAHSILLDDVVDEVIFVLQHRNLLVADSADHVRLIFFSLFSRVVRVNSLSCHISEDLGSDKTVGILRPHVCLVVGASLLSHGALETSLYHSIALGEHLIVEECLRLESGNLRLYVEWVNENEVDSISLLIPCLLALASRQESEMSAAFDPESHRVESDILKLVEGKPSDKLLFWS